MRLNFFCSNDYVKNNFPIYPAKKRLSEFRKQKEWNTSNTKLNDLIQGHVKNCPGIMDIIKAGYIIPAWKDFLVDVKDNKIRIQTIQVEGNNLEITIWNDPSRIINEDDSWCDEVVKLNSPWICKSKALILFKSIAYNKNSFFEVYEGIVDPNTHPGQDIFLKFKREDAQYFIKAGTPLAQIIPFNINTNFELNLEANKKEFKNHIVDDYYKDIQHPKNLIYGWFRKHYMKHSRKIRYE